jgi:hypothetical protein
MEIGFFASRSKRDHWYLHVWVLLVSDIMAFWSREFAIASGSITDE